MKKLLLLCVLFAACLAPVAEGAVTWPVNVVVDNNKKVKEAIDTVLSTVVQDPEFQQGSEIIITIADGNTANIDQTIEVPYTNKYDNGTGTEVEVTISQVTVEGGGTVKADGAWRLFDIAAGGTATFNDVTLDGNNHSGGGVATAGTTTFEGVTFQYNGVNPGTNGPHGALAITAGTTTLKGTNTFTSNRSNTNGGAIYLDSAGTLKMDNSPTLNFTNNSATNGGAIHSEKDLDLSETTVTFQGNTATKNGGAIHSTGKVTIADATFGGAGDTDLNTAENGGAIYAASVELTGDSATFTRNKATAGSGGAIYSTTDAVNVASGTFSNNTASVTVAGKSANGGAIYSLKGAVNITSGTFNNNKASATDTGVEANGGAIYSKGAVNITTGTFRENTASVPGGAAGQTARGGAIYADEKIEITGGAFDKNTALQGGVAYSYGGNVTISGTPTFGTVDANSATGKDGNGGGGVIYTASLTKGTVEISGGTFSNNKAGTDDGAGNIKTGHGGVVRAAAKVTITGGTFTTKNSATGNGGAIWSASEIETSTADFSNQTAANGGALYAPTVTVNSGKFDNNSATADGGAGGAVYAGTTATVTGGSFGETTKNTAKRGGAIYADTANINGGTFTNNEATGITDTSGGGAVYANTVNLSGNPTFNKNTTGQYGGAIYTESSLIVKGGDFNNNGSRTSTPPITTSKGGAVYSAGTVGITGGAFSGNTANDGGAVYAVGKVTVAKGDDTTADFTNTNTAANNGGAIYSESEIVTSDTEFSNQTALNSGGALYAEKSVTVKSGSSFYSNTTTNTTTPGREEVGGGAIYSKNDVIVEAEAGDFSGNIDASNTKDDAVANNNSGGGAIHAARDVTIRGGNFDSNVSHSNGESSGGGAVWAGRNVMVYSNSFNSPSDKRNTTDGNGGAIYAIENITIDPRNTAEKKCTFSNQKATKENTSKGGALYAGEDIVAQNTVFQLNTAGSDGGATWSGGKSTFTKCLFGGIGLQNEATHGYGGAILAQYGLSATDCTFQENFAKEDGGAISVKNGDEKLNTISNCVFDQNKASGSGGAIHAVGRQVGLTVMDSLFFKNTAGSGGGAIVTDASPLALILQRCTFQGNKSAQDGGALNIDVQQFLIANCTFFGNESENGNGGALQLAGGRGGTSSLVFSTIAKNYARKGDGGGIHSSAAFSLGANIVIGNEAARGSDIFGKSEGMKSSGYNYLSKYGETIASETSWKAASYVSPRSSKDGEEYNNYSFDLFFGDGVEPAKNASGDKYPPHIGVSEPINPTDDGFWERTLDTLALRTGDIEKRPNPVLSRIPKADGSLILNGSTDERGVSRPSRGDSSKWDVGAYDTGLGESGDTPDKPERDGSIKYIRISGLPNTLRTIGQTTSLFVYGYDIDWNLVNRNVAVTWTPEPDDGIVQIEGGTGNIYILRVVKKGKVKIIATTSSGITDYVVLTVDPESEYASNIHPRWWEGVALQQLANNDMYLDTASVSSTVTTTAFQNDFKERWGATVSLVPDDNSVVATSPTAVPALTKDDVKPGIRLSVSNLEKGSILPLTYSWTLDYNQLSKLLDRNVTTPPSAAELAKVVRIDFENIRSVRVPVIDGSNGGTFNVATAQYDKVGVKAMDAALTGALHVQQAADSNSATISLTAYLANVDDVNNKGAQLIQRLLVVPDGMADGGISGTMWMSQKAESSNNNSDNNNNSNNGNGGGGGGGGCDAAGLGLAVLLLALPLLAQRRR